MKKSLFLSLLLIGGIALAGCQKSEWETEVSESKYPVAEQVCVDNGWVVTVDEEGADICLLGERAIYLANMEENPEDSNGLKLYEGMLIEAEKNIRGHIRVRKNFIYVINFLYFYKYRMSKN